MPRRKISEFRSKLIVSKALGLDYSGWEVSRGNIPILPHEGRFVLKVDQAIKQRFKRGLVYLDLAAGDVRGCAKKITDKGFRHLLIEPFYAHDNAAERYISLRRERHGVVLSYSRHGGVEIESAASSIKSGHVDQLSLKNVSEESGFTEDQLRRLIESFNSQHMTLLEINPYIIKDGFLKVLDVAIEVDSAAEPLVDEWSEGDFRSPITHLTQEEEVVQKLNNESPASFNLEVINPDGGIFLLLSGGGASVVIADEIFTMGYGSLLANYGEYSGNPSTEETELYTEQVIKLLIKSKAKTKVVFIGGAVANFTDIKNTFDGIIHVLRKYGPELRQQGVRVYVRRGGPRQQAGLQAITEAIDTLGILGSVYDPSTTIPAAVSSLVKGLKS